MNEIELKSRAQRIADRLNAWGFTKDGKPMVIDQAYELVAAGEGLRNQHVLRVLAKKATGLDAAVSTFVHDVFSSSLAPSFERAIAEAWQYAKKKLDLSEALFDAAPFEAQLVMLESALTGESKVVELDCVSEDERHRALAQEAYENYQFPTEVVEASGWESWSGSGLFRRSVFLATTDGEDTRKVIFEVKVSGEAVKASVSNS